MNKGERGKVVMTPELFSSRECLISGRTQCFWSDIHNAVPLRGAAVCFHSLDFYTSVLTFFIGSLVLRIIIPTFFFSLLLCVLT